MLTWARYLLIVSLTAVLLTGPVLSAPSLKPSCAEQPANVSGVTKSRLVSQHACCTASPGGTKSCCHRADSSAANERDTGCGSCPLGQCGCCQTSQGLTVVGVLPDQAGTAPRVLAVPLTTIDSVLISRSDEPLLPPPIA